jgi:hyperosmotically inducible protein
MKTNRIVTDEVLLRRLHERIRWDIRVSNSDIVLKVKEGVVHLYGYFDKPYRHSAAMGVVAATEGVFDLIDHSCVLADYYRSDKELDTLIKKQISSWKFLPGEWVSVAVVDGVAKLDGKLCRPRFKAFAGQAVWQLSGIKDCINMIELTDPPKRLRIGAPLPNEFRMENNLDS